MTVCPRSLWIFTTGAAKLFVRIVQAANASSTPSSGRFSLMAARDSAASACVSFLSAAAV
jgi:hypothetical protein